jgi:hypothetical protein
VMHRGRNSVAPPWGSMSGAQGQGSEGEEEEQSCQSAQRIDVPSQHCLFPQQWPPQGQPSHRKAASLGSTLDAKLQPPQPPIKLPTPSRATGAAGSKANAPAHSISHDTPSCAFISTELQLSQLQRTSAPSLPPRLAAISEQVQPECKSSQRGTCLDCKWTDTVKSCPILLQTKRGLVDGLSNSCGI